LSELGVCWSTKVNPTVKDAHRSTHGGSESYASIIGGLAPGTEYHVRAYVLCGLHYFYGDDKSFVTEADGDGDINEHDYVDLGLPSGTLWATCNVGARIPEAFGDFLRMGGDRNQRLLQLGQLQIL
jgi:hypothetical protein